ncbi:hypothetical protein ABEW34_21530 [Paenibacillus algorifonticola]|uniref:hypothetical protein n=1 Tax=Paenibacillus algorifonticola TaxID=684063 RepID=UPI003D2A9EC4
MHVLVCGLSVEAILPPTLLLQVVDTQEMMEHVLLHADPTVIVIAEELATGSIERMASLAPQVPIAVVAKAHTHVIARQWASQGMTWVWPFENWAEHMRLTLLPDPRVESVQTTEMESLLQQHEIQDTIVIAVAGLFDGAGSTHMALSIANQLAGHGNGRVALWEASSKPCFQFLAFNAAGEFSHKPRFQMGTVTCFKDTADMEWVEAYSESFKYLIVDLGNIHTTLHAKRFFQATIPVLVASSSSWRQQELARFIRKNSHMRQDKWRILLPMTTDEAYDEMLEAYAGRHFIAIPAFDAFHPHDEAAIVLDQLVEPVSIKRPSLLQRIFHR